jgi:hypothetical protein
VPGIEGPSIKTNVETVAAFLYLSFCAVVTKFTERLQRTGEELQPIAAVRLDVIDHGRRHDRATFETKRTQWMGHELLPADSLPARRSVQFHARM